MRSVASPRRNFIIRLVTGILACAVLLGIARLLLDVDLHATLLQLLEMVERAGAGGQLLFVAMASFAVVALLPSVLLTLAAGFLYGPWYGALIMVIAETIGALFAFTLVRQGLAQTQLERVQASQTLAAVQRVLATDGWQHVAAVRMIPFFPFKLSNYVFGLTTISTRHYLGGTLVGLWPITLFNTYLGSLAADLMTLGDTTHTRTPLEWAMLSAGFVLVSAFLGYWMLRTYRLFRQPEAREGSCGEKTR